MGELRRGRKMPAAAGCEESGQGGGPTGCWVPGAGAGPCVLPHKCERGKPRSLTATRGLRFSNRPEPVGA